MMEIAILLFDKFETLDVFGPVEIFGRLPNQYSMAFYSLQGGRITSTQGVTVLTKPITAISGTIEVFLIPGGVGTRQEVDHPPMLEAITSIAATSRYILTVCTGSALLAKTGILNHKTATSNKRSFGWVVCQGPEVHWNKTARWTVDGKIYTSSGVSAGMDMTLGFLADRHGIELARKIAFEIEYRWIEDKDNDSFQAEGEQL